MRTAALFLSAGVLSLLAAGLAQAAEIAPAEATDVEAVIITGEKVGRSVQETVTSVAVVGAKQIEQQNIQNFADIVQRTANMSDTYGATGFTIRGVSNTSVSGGGSAGLATVYVDGASIPERGLANGPLEMWDISQVEILRGPQSTLQGRNAMAGAVIIRSAEPTFDFSGKARLIMTDAKDRSFAVAVSGPLIADQLAFRVSAEERHKDGFIRNITRGGQEDALDASTVRAQLMFTPTALPGLKLRAIWTHDERQGAYIYTYVRTDRPNFYDQRVSISDYPNSSDSKTDMLTLEGDYRLNDRFSLSSVTAWSKVDNFSRYDGDDTDRPLSYGDSLEGEESLSQELRLNYQGERLSGVVGLWYSKRERDYDLKSLTNVDTPQPTLAALLQTPAFGSFPAAQANAIATQYVAALPVIPVNFKGVSYEDITTTALFADGRYQLTDKLSILGGFRYDREENEQAVDQVTTFAGIYPNPTNFGPLAPVIAGLNFAVSQFVAQANATTPAYTRTFEAFLPKLGVKYDFTDDISASFVVQRGYRSGGSSVNQARSSVVAYDPEYTWNYEAALRTQWLDRTLTVNANAYYVDWTDQQVAVNMGLNAYDTQIQNAGASHLYGFEIEAAHQVNPSLDWYASLGHTKTKFDEFNVTIGALTTDLAGSEFPFAPAWTLAGGVNWRWGNGFIGNLNANYRTESYSSVGVDQKNYKVPARTLVNAKVGWENQAYGIYAYANNLLDEQYIQYNQAALNRAMLGDPRVIGFMVEARW
ncbi:TonB-dependent receptor [Caulobacter mirabilis]|uniref:TonB-dependent receptor n=1 Tax=Caulobacter mirabilis TaxID=69666 RepID=A0A2D2AZ29_9CAUL|nr:TonB-dependent receptor [Caulobacter mirabilis]ATQ43187.1 TonB-dependent receptor [Caulobacter mirabilis]